jgi:zinc/manganese transport system permease protein
VSPSPSWNIVADIAQMWSFPFMVTAFRAGTIVAVSAAVMGWFMVLRKQTFAGHTLAVVGFPGAAGAVLLGISASVGYFGACLAAALALALIPRADRAHDSAVTGTVQAFALSCGFAFVALYKGFLNGGINDLLFGTITGITGGQVMILLAVGVAVLAVIAAVGRPLLFATVDPLVAQAKGVPVRGLSLVFLVLLGAAVAQASQITGALLVFALLVMPAATAQAVTARPAVSLALSVVVALLITWTGLSAAYYSIYPIGFFITSFGFGAYLLALLSAKLRGAFA